MCEGGKYLETLFFHRRRSHHFPMSNTMVTNASHPRKNFLNDCRSVPPFWVAISAVLPVNTLFVRIIWLWGLCVTGINGPYNRVQGLKSKSALKGGEKTGLVSGGGRGTLLLLSFFHMPVQTGADGQREKKGDRLLRFHLRLLFFFHRHTAGGGGIRSALTLQRTGAQKMQSAPPPPPPLQDWPSVFRRAETANFPGEKPPVLKKERLNSSAGN